jgi:hypothetical protein
MRRYVWGILLLLIVMVAFLRSSVVPSNRDHRSRAVVTRVSPPDFKAMARVEPVPPVPSVSAAPPAPPAKRIKMPRIGLKSHPQEPEDPERVVYSTEVIGRYSPSPEEAWEDVWDQTRTQVTHDLHLDHAAKPEFVKSKLRYDYSQEPGPKVEGVGETVRIVAKVEMTARVWHELAEMQRSARAEDRMDVVARGLAVLTALLGAVAGYIRLDEWTKGYYTGRLRLAVIALVALAAVAVIA